MKGLLDKSGGEIIGFTKMFPIEPAFQNFTKFLTESQKNIEAYYPQIEQLDFYRYFCKLFFWDVIYRSDNHMLLENSSSDKYIFINANNVCRTKLNWAAFPKSIISLSWL